LSFLRRIHKGGSPHGGSFKGKVAIVTGAGSTPGEGWDIDYASLFLVSDEAKYITGQVMAVDGGILCKA